MEAQSITFQDNTRGTEFEDLPQVLAGRYQMQNMIGRGTFGAVFVARSNQSGLEYAVKYFKHLTPTLQVENEVLQKMDGCEGFTTARFYHSHGHYNSLVMELLGDSLRSLLKRSGGRFSIPTVVRIAIQTLKRIEALHRHGYIHRDIKPSNLLIGRGSKAGCVYLTDFGLAKKWFDEATQAHIPYRHHRWNCGTLPFSSAKVQNGDEPSRKDDLISLGYTWVYLCKGSLPWLNLSGTKEEIFREILRLKQTYPYEALYLDMPKEFVAYHCKVCALHFDEEPDYAGLRKPFERLLLTFHREDRVFDWLFPPSPSSPDSSHISSEAPLPAVNTPDREVTRRITSEGSAQSRQGKGASLDSRPPPSTSSSTSSLTQPGTGGKQAQHSDHSLPPPPLPPPPPALPPPPSLSSAHSTHTRSPH